MGLLEGIVGMFLNGDTKKYKAILDWINQQGGVQTLLDKLRQGGLSAIVESWLSSNATNNMLSAEQITSALGSPAVAALASKLGIDAGTASSMLAEYLPKVIDVLSPHGDIAPEAQDDLMSAGLKMLKGK